MARIQPQITGVLTVLFAGLVASYWYLVSFQFTGGIIYFFFSLIMLVGVLVLREIWGDVIPQTQEAQELDRNPKAVLIGFGRPKAAYIGYGAALGGGFTLLSLYGFSIGLPSGTSALALTGPYLALDNKFLIVVLMAPGIEEATFRSVIYSWAYNKSGNVHLAAGVSAFSFSIYHFYAYGPYLQTAFVAAGLFGFAAAEVGAFTGSLWAPWVGHTIYNFSIFGQVFGFAVVVG